MAKCRRTEHGIARDRGASAMMLNPHDLLYQLVVFVCLFVLLLGWFLVYLFIYFSFQRVVIFFKNNMNKATTKSNLAVPIQSLNPLNGVYIRASQ